MPNDTTPGAGRADDGRCSAPTAAGHRCRRRAEAPGAPTCTQHAQAILWRSRRKYPEDLCEAVRRWALRQSRRMDRQRRRDAEHRLHVLSLAELGELAERMADAVERWEEWVHFGLIEAGHDEPTIRAQLRGHVRDALLYGLLSVVQRDRRPDRGLRLVQGGRR